MSPYSLRMRKNKDHKNLEYEHFYRNMLILSVLLLPYCHFPYNLNSKLYYYKLFSWQWRGKQQRSESDWKKNWLIINFSSINNKDKIEILPKYRNTASHLWPPCRRLRVCKQMCVIFELAPAIDLLRFYRFNINSK